MKELDWKNLPFAYQKADTNVRCYYKDGKWGDIELSQSEYINMHMASTCLHYGQEIFEGMKAYRGKDGKIRLFRWEENAKRMIASAEYIKMKCVSVDIFKKAVFKVVKENESYIPPYGTGASLYIRPLLIGTGAEIGVKPSQEYMFIVFVMPVGPYFKKGFNPVDIVITREYDRAAPLGTGHVKVGGNYAAGLMAQEKAKSKGYSAVLYLDSKEKKYIDECGPANFFAIKDGKYITPDSKSVLPSITNMSLQVLAKDMGLTVDKRQILVEELDTFEEVGQCGTAAVISPVKQIVDEEKNKTYVYCEEGQPGPICEKLYNQLVSIQYGEMPDNHGWISIVE